MTFGEKLQKLRRESGLSQEKLAEQLHVSRQAISKWELGTAAPDTDNIVRLSKFFQVPLEYLMLEDCTDPSQAIGWRAQPQTPPEEIPAEAPSQVSKPSLASRFQVSWHEHKHRWLFGIGLGLELLSFVLCYGMQRRAIELYWTYYTNALVYMIVMPLLVPTSIGAICLLKGLWEWWKRVPEEREPFRYR
jgi:transcriptional regulator with XRE-family HTH domain